MLGHSSAAYCRCQPELLGTWAVHLWESTSDRLRYELTAATNAKESPARAQTLNICLKSPWDAFLVVLLSGARRSDISGVKILQIETLKSWLRPPHSLRNGLLAQKTHN